MRKLKKRFFVITGSILAIAMILILCISPLVKYLVEKYDEKYTGREIKMDWAYVNPFTGYIYFKELKIFELKSDSVFISTNSVSLSISLLKLFSGTYEINEILLDHPVAVILQNKKDLNFNDLIRKFSTDSSATKKAPVHFNILNIKIKSCEVHYREVVTPINYFIRELNFESEGKYWDTDTIGGRFSFVAGIGSGDMKGDFTINFKKNEYRLSTLVRKFDLNIIRQYLKDLINYGTFSASLEADIKATGSFVDREQITASGVLAINDFHFGKSSTEDYASFKKLKLVVFELSPKKYVYSCDSVLLVRPFFKYERYDNLDNLQAIFGKKGVNVSVANVNSSRFNLILEIAKYIRALSVNFFRSHYKINRLAITEGALRFNDFSVNEKFSAAFSPLNITADSIDKERASVEISLSSGIKPFGNLEATLSMDPKNDDNFDLHYQLRNLPVALFNPYTISFTSFLLDRGTIELNGNWNVKKGFMKGQNRFVVIDPRISHRVINKNTKWIPMRFLLFFAREQGNIIDYELPISGNLKHLKLHYRDVILNIVKNIFVKPATSPYRTKVKNTELEIERSLTLTWNMRSSGLYRRQAKFLRKMADFLESDTNASIRVYPKQYGDKEKEHILLYEARKKYYLSLNKKNVTSFDQNDSEKVEKMSVKDVLFLRFLNLEVKDPMLFTVQEKCERLIGLKLINERLSQLNKDREAMFLSYFIKKEIKTKILFVSAESLIPYNGFSFYKIEYVGSLPRALSRAYRRMDNLNRGVLRKEFRLERKKAATG